MGHLIERKIRFNQVVVYLVLKIYLNLIPIYDFLYLLRQHVKLHHLIYSPLDEGATREPEYS